MHPVHRGAATVALGSCNAAWCPAVTKATAARTHATHASGALAAAAAASSSTAAATAMKRNAEVAFVDGPLYMCDICHNWRGNSLHGLLCHRERSLLCSQVERGDTVAVAAAPLGESPKPSADALTLRAMERQHEVVDVLTDLRVQKLVPGTHVQSVKDALATRVLPVMRRHLQLELQSQVNCSADELREIVARCTGLFDGIETSSREHAALLNREGFVRRLSTHLLKHTSQDVLALQCRHPTHRHPLHDAPHLCCCARLPPVPDPSF